MMEYNDNMTIEHLVAALNYVTDMPTPTQSQLEKFLLYNNILLEYNQHINLTRIVTPVDVSQKHFADSLLPISLIPYGAKCVDIGTGAGFPGIPLKIMRPDIQLTLVDSLAKRIKFLNRLCQSLSIDAVAIHARAEDAARQPSLRCSFDVALSRAVASTRIITEITVPFLIRGGISLVYKTGNQDNEIAVASNALAELRAEAYSKQYDVPWGNRTILIVRKKSDTPRLYPRRPSVVEKYPL